MADLCVVSRALQIVVHAAGASQRSRAEDTSQEVLSKIISLNGIAPIALSQVRRLSSNQ